MVDPPSRPETSRHHRDHYPGFCQLWLDVEVRAEIFLERVWGFPRDVRFSADPALIVKLATAGLGRYPGFTRDVRPTRRDSPLVRAHGLGGCLEFAVEVGVVLIGVGPAGPENHCPVIPTQRLAAKEHGILVVLGLGVSPNIRGEDPRILQFGEGDRDANAMVWDVIRRHPQVPYHHVHEPSAGGYSTISTTAQRPRPFFT